MTTRERFEKLLHDACVIYGNCGSGDTHISDYLPKSGELSANEFARLMLKAEKMSEAEYGEQYRKGHDWCAERFRQTMGAEVVEASEIWRVSE
jgi:hypothetical protein